MNKSLKKILDYYNSPESKLGYRFLTWERKHFGFYPDGEENITEEKAQELIQDKIAQNLKLKSSDLVLDAGCGYGTVACYLSKKYGAGIKGIDINLYEINRARNYSRRFNVEDKTGFEVMDYSRMKFPDHYFDAIYTMETLSHAIDLKKTLKEFLRVLKPGGRIALFEYTLAPENNFSAHELSILNIGIDGTCAFGLKEFRHRQFTNYLKQSGFYNAREQNITKNFLPSLTRLRRYAFLPYIVISLCGLQKYFANTFVAVEWYKLVKKDLIRYSIFTAIKPTS